MQRYIARSAIGLAVLAVAALCIARRNIVPIAVDNSSANELRQRLFAAGVEISEDTPDEGLPRGLRIGSDVEVTDELVQAINACHSLRELRIIGCRDTDRLLQNLSPGLGLESIEIREGSLTDSGFAVLLRFTSLRRVDIEVFEAAKFTGRGVADIGQLAQLRELRLCSLVIGKNVIGINRLKNLQVLSLARSQFDESHLDGIEKMRTLHSLDMAFTSLTSRGCAHLARLPGLTDLDLRMCLRVDDMALRQFETCSGIRRLNLSGASLTDVSVGVISRSFPALSYLDLTKAGISSAGIDSLRLRFPTAEILPPGDMIDRTRLRRG